MAHEREQLGLPPAKPYEYEKARTQNLRDNAVLREIAILCGRYSVTLTEVRNLVTGVLNNQESVQS